MNLKRSIFCAVFLSSFILLQSPAFAEMVSIRGENVNMRSGPGTKYEVLWKIGQGFPLQVTKKSGTWLQVRDFEGSVGWVQVEHANGVKGWIREDLLWGD